MDLAAIFTIFADYVAQSMTTLDSVSQRLIHSLAVVYVITMAGIEKFKAEPDPGQMIIRAVLRIGITLLLFNRYDSLILQPFYHGLLQEVAFQIGTPDVLGTLWEITIKMVGYAEAQSIWEILGGPRKLLGMLGALIGFVIYAFLMGLIASLILTAGFYLVIGKLMLCTLIFPFSESLFLGWLRGLLGAMFGVCAFWFFMGALQNYTMLFDLPFKLTQIEDPADLTRVLFDFLIVMITALMLALQARDIGRGMV